MATETTTLPAQLFRFSTGAVGPKEEVPDFPWDYAVPTTPFWNTFEHHKARSFLVCFTSAELSHFSLNEEIQYASAPQPEKLTVLHSLLQKKLQAEESKYPDDDSAAGFPKSDAQLWARLVMAISGIDQELGRIEDAEHGLRVLVAGEPENLVYAFNLAGFLVENTDKYEEARGLAVQSRDWVDGRVGRASPQGIGARKTVAMASWKMGEVERAKGEIEEVWQCVGELKGTRFAVYEEEEREGVREWEASVGV
ncbi:hypothetical protein BO71DRAFT_432867 [Aspergillus ellipticus CBS 707.79]|uniref:Tetratricopeptide repeat domain protein n=1 Tax=Aspergillus ellipticus CBS 707.79 TaxID=1448320 RepID=A0A319EKE8_9EURO|nr:hypothetical protein BO71DRAFT_432867 [Aspergillus ellipticus CBS 707.79]